MKTYTYGKSMYGGWYAQLNSSNGDEVFKSYVSARTLTELREKVKSQGGELAYRFDN